jgi:hypothetical protein
MKAGPKRAVDDSVLPGRPMGTNAGRCDVKTGMYDIEREAVRAEGLDPDDPAVVEALDRVRAMFRRRSAVGRINRSGRKKTRRHAANDRQIATFS